MRIAVAGFQHETNTFAPGQAGLAEFEMADSWPGLLTGEAVVEQTRGMNLPIAGAIAAADGVEIVPLLWCAAEPSGPVTGSAFERISGMILDGLRAAGPMDGICLDLHGAMVTQSHDDGEGALLALLRHELGTGMPIGVSLDLHANVSPEMAALADVITIYRTYPHLDMAETGARCMQRLVQVIEGRRFACAFRQIPFLVPLHAQYTGADPCRELYGRLVPLDAEESYAEIAMGFTAADIPHCGPSIVAYAASQVQADRIADDLLAATIAARDTFDAALLDPAEAVALALAAEGPTVLSDVQDNPGAGGTSDTTGLLRALVDAQATGAILGVLSDPEAAARAHELGPDAIFDAALGGKSGLPGDQPLAARFRVERVDDGHVRYTGEMYGGGIATLGPSCVLSVDAPGTDIRIVVSTNRIQCLDLALFTHFGLDLSRSKIVAAKSTVHHRAAFEPIAQRVVNVAAPGAFPCRLSMDDYRNLRPGVTSVIG